MNSSEPNVLVRVNPSCTVRHEGFELRAGDTLSIPLSQALALSGNLTVTLLDPIKQDVDPINNEAADDEEQSIEPLED
jgi:hypothetical protein